MTALFRGRDRYYAGVIENDNNDGTYAIKYDDGDIESKVEHKLVRLRGVDAPVRIASESEMLRARLQMLEANQQAYHAHLIRDKNQSCFKVNLILQNQIKLTTKSIVSSHFYITALFNEKNQKK